MTAAVFLDKDRTLVEDVPYNVDPARIRLMPRAGDALRLLAGCGYRLIVVSNQSGVARGYFAENKLTAVEKRLRQLFTAEGAELGGFYWCPHHPEGIVPTYAVWCSCRKPAPGLLLQAADEHGIDLRRSWMVGDILDDIEAGNRAGCRTVLLANGGETQWILDRHRIPTLVSRDLEQASRRIAAYPARSMCRRPAAAPPREAVA